MRVDLDAIGGADTLTHLAYLLRQREPDFRARRSLTSDALEELADMIADGRTPTLGWWRRARRVQAESR